MTNAIATPKQALVVGANGGIGFGFVEKLLADSRVEKIYATYRRAETADRLLALAATHRDRLVCWPMDLADESQIAAVIAEIGSQSDRLHWVINAVGLLHDGELQPEKSLRHLQSDRLLRYFQVNSIGGALLAKHVHPLLRHGDRSVFASISAKVGSIGDNFLGGWYGYRASKAALNMLMRNVAIEFRRTSPNTIVVVLHPGTTDTELSRPFQKGVPPEKLFPVDRTVMQLLAILENLNSEDSGAFFSWDGTPLPW